MRKISVKLSAISLGLALIILGASPALAEEASSQTTSGTEQHSTTSIEPATTTATEQETTEPPATTSTEKETTEPTTTENKHTATNEAELSTDQLKLCQNREKEIDNVMSRMTDRGEKQLNVFSTIAARVETFYAEKGKTVSNYSALVADINAKQAAAQAAVTNIKNASTSFTCTGTTPISSVISFKSDLQTEIKALQAYRTSIRNLIVAVKSIEGTTSSGSTANQTSRGGNQ